MKRVPIVVIQSVSYKECTKCHRLLPLSEYRKLSNPKHPDYLRSECRECTDLMFAVWRQNNINRAREISRNSKRRCKERMTPEQLDDERAKNRIRDRLRRRKKALRRLHPETG